MTPSGIEPATFGLVAQCLNQLRHRVLTECSKWFWIQFLRVWFCVWTLWDCRLLLCHALQNCSRSPFANHIQYDLLPAQTEGEGRHNGAPVTYFQTNPLFLNRHCSLHAPTHTHIFQFVACIRSHTQGYDTFFISFSCFAQFVGSAYAVLCYHTTWLVTHLQRVCCVLCSFVVTRNLSSSEHYSRELVQFLSQAACILFSFVFLLLLFYPFSLPLFHSHYCPLPLFSSTLYNFHINFSIRLFSFCLPPHILPDLLIPIFFLFSYFLRKCKGCTKQIGMV